MASSGHKDKGTKAQRSWRRVLLLIVAYHLSLIASMAQIGTWKNFLSYHEVQQICKAGDYLFVRASNGLYQYNLNDQSITTYDKTSGLSDTFITHIAWCQQAKRLIIVYQDANIDLLDTDGNTINISALYKKAMTVDKTVNTVYVSGKHAYLAMGFGIIKLNMADAEISETYMLNHNITNIDIRGEDIYAMATDKYYETHPYSEEEIPLLVNFSSKVENKITIYDIQAVFKSNFRNNPLDSRNWAVNHSFPPYLFETDNNDFEKYHELVSQLNPGGPKYNLFGFMKFGNNKLYTCAGGDNSSVTTPAIQVMKDGEWQIFQDEGIQEQTGVVYRNINCVDYDPLDDTHVFAGARAGLYEFKDGKFINFYNDENSPIESFNGKSKNYEMVYGLCFDRSGTLWFMNSQAPTQSLIEYTRDGKFVSHYLEDIMKLDAEGYYNKSLGSLASLMFDSKGYLWFVNNHFIMPSFYRHDLGSNTTLSFRNLINQDGTEISNVRELSCITEDKDGNIWFATNVGPFMLEKSQFEESNPIITQVKVPRNDGTNYADYLLSNIDITSIAIDEGGRKWFGTNGNGVYLISADNIKQLQHFTTENSQLLSDIVKSIAINNETGEVFFGTENGLCSYISDATTINENMTKDNVSVYPNPVTPDYTGLISVVGLSYDADVKILSSNGALIAEGRSNGGTFTWDGKDKQGRRVASGVYMVAIATSSGQKGTVCKIAVIN